MAYKYYKGTKRKNEEILLEKIYKKTHICGYMELQKVMYSLRKAKVKKASLNFIPMNL